MTVCVSLLAIFISNHVARMTFDQGRDVAVPGPGQEIAFPMTRDRTIFNCCRRRR